jgi:chorismate dehydratase
MKRLIKISIVSYINTLPYRFALEQSDFIKDNAIISSDIPSVCAEKLKNNKADIGLIPVAAICDLDYYEIIGDFCLSGGKKVFSVELVSEVPLYEIEKIYLDFHSRTSVEMLKIIAEKHLKLKVEWLNTQKGFENSICGTTAGLIIGDKAMQLQSNYKYVYDLSELWQEFTGTFPVFALWVANKPIDMKFKIDFLKVLEFGVQNIDEIVSLYAADYPEYNLKKYFTKQIIYKLDNNRKSSARYLYQEICNSVLKI